MITSGNEESRFTVGYKSGIVSLAKPITKPANLEITANDHGSPPRKAVLKLSLNPVAAQARGPPRLLLPNPIAKIFENLHVGSHVANVAGPATVDQGKTKDLIILAQSFICFHHATSVRLKFVKFLHYSLTGRLNMKFNNIELDFRFMILAM